MSQTYTTNPYAGGTVVATTMTAVNNNFEALKSAFSGASAPANTVAGQWWLDTTAHILKIRNEANTAWLSVWDMANNKPIIANLSNEITLAMMAASTKSPAAGTEGLRKLGTGALDAMAGNTDVTPANGSITEAKLASGAVTMAKMKAPTAVATTIIARWQEAETATTGTLATLYVTVSGNIRVYCQLVKTDAVITISKNGSSVTTLTGTGPFYADFTYGMAVTLGDRIDFSFSGDGASSKVRYGRIYSGTSIGAVS